MKGPGWDKGVRIPMQTLVDKDATSFTCLTRSSQKLLPSILESNLVLVFFGENNFPFSNGLVDGELVIARKMGQ